MERVRRTQAERTATTRAALLQATVDTLVQRGYSRTTTTDVARAAGVSPGALLHHFPTKADLLGAAVRHVFEQRTAEFRTLMADLPPDVARGGAAVDVLWSMFSGPTFVAWLELWVAARTDPELARVIVEVDDDFFETSQQVFREVFAEECAADPNLPAVAVGLVYAFLDGMALSQLVPRGNQALAAEVLSVFKLLVTNALPDDPQRSTQP